MVDMNTESHSSLMSRHDKEHFSTVDIDHQQMAQSEIQPQRSRLEWQPGFWTHFPWMGLCSLLLALLMSIVSVIVLCVSDDKAASQWSNRIAPNVILTILNSAASLCFVVAVSRGIAISWWRKASKGTAVQDLSRSWSFGNDALAFLFHARYFNLIALAALGTKLSIIDGILFQRATTTYVALGPQAQHSLTTFPTDAFPTTGFYDANPATPSYLDNSFTYDVGTWIRSGGDSVESTYGFNDCQGVCSVKYRGPGFAMSCSSRTEEVDFLENNFGNAGINTTSTSTTVDLFDISFNYTHATTGRNYSWIGLNMTSYDTQDQTSGTLCPAKLLLQQCELRPAILNYPVVVELTNVPTKLQYGNSSQESVVNVYLGQLNDTDGSWEGIRNFDPNLGQVTGFEILSYMNLTGQPAAYSSTLIGGIMLAMQDFYTSRVSLTLPKNDTSMWYTSDQGLIGSLSVDGQLPSKSNASCPVRTRNPLQVIITYLNKLTFIMSDDLYNRPSWQELLTVGNATNAQIDAYRDSVAVSTEGVQYKAEVHYKTDYGFMYGALASTLFCIILIIPSFWGFWELGRQVSFDPVEVGHAFGAPALAGTKIIGGHAKEVVTVAGREYVRYTEDDTGARVFQRVAH